MAEKLQRLNIYNLQDVLFHLPLRYEDRTRVVPIGALRRGDRAVIEGVIEHTDTGFSRSGKRSRRMLMCYLADGSGGITLRFFHFSKAQQENLRKGIRLRVFGEVRQSGNRLEMAHPEYNAISEHDTLDVADTLTPIYPTTEGVHQLTLRRLSEQVLEKYNHGESDLLTELMPENLLAMLSLPTLKNAINTIHHPPADVSLSKLESGTHPAQQRLAFEELVAHQLSLLSMRQKIQQHHSPKLDNGAELMTAFLQQLPFELTAAQQRVIHVIQQDVAQQKPMLRLVQGDVGSGKTVVAAAAVIMAVHSGYQATVMAPTEILAEQHYKNFCTWLEPLGVKVAWLSGKLKNKIRQQMLEVLASGEAAVAVGTHALFQEDVVFKQLALVVVDEQHRFGVHQRLALKQKGDATHQLIMTATPIPRTLAMTAYGDLDYSVIDELPPGRTPVKTVVIPEGRRDEVIHRVRAAIAEGRQVYWVCTLIEESEALQCQAAEDTCVLLSEQMPEFLIGLVHGRMKPVEKETVMQRFKNKELDLLVATTVIEVGVDVPNASLMIIENAERLGLSQLHQLRGRVGRGSTASSCVLMYSSPLSKLAKARLAVMRETNSGFEVAEHDLKMRGPGEVLGTRQTGMMQFRIADILRDESLLPAVQQVSEQVMNKHPGIIEPLIRRWLAGAEQYSEV